MNAIQDTKLKALKRVQRAWMQEADSNRFHPVQAYLDKVTWDGDDHIGALASYFEDKDGLFPLYIRKFLVGCVAKVYERDKYSRGGLSSVRTRMLVLEGGQSLGKSFFARWLCPLPSMFAERAINPDDKDYRLAQASTWIWEVSELGSTTRRADREALKAFLSNTSVRERKAYGRYDIHKPTLANFIGTVNDESGFLSDPTGSERFLVLELVRIDWSYTDAVSLDQLWAHAKYLYESGEDWNLSPEERLKAVETNERFSVENILETRVHEWFEIEPEETEWHMTTADIEDHIRDQANGRLNSQYITRDLAGILKKAGLEKVRRRTVSSPKKPVRGWLGIRTRKEPEVTKGGLFGGVSA